MSYVTKRAKELGLKLVDATEPVKLRVAKLDIERATRKNSKCCAFARACKRQLDVKAAYFFRSTAYLEFDKQMVKYQLPPSVQKEIVSFDRAGITAPGVYQLSPVPPHNTRVAIAKRSKKRAGSHGETGKSGRKTRLRHRTLLVRNTLEPTGT